MNCVKNCHCYTRPRHTNTDNSIWRLWQAKAWAHTASQPDYPDYMQGQRRQWVRCFLLERMGIWRSFQQPWYFDQISLETSWWQHSSWASKLLQSHLAWDQSFVDDTRLISLNFWTQTCRHAHLIVRACVTSWDGVSLEGVVQHSLERIMCYTFKVKVYLKSLALLMHARHIKYVIATSERPHYAQNSHRPMPSGSVWEND